MKTRRHILVLLLCAWAAASCIYDFDPQIDGEGGTWQRQGYYRKEIVFEGDAKVGVGSENEKFVGYDALVDRMMESHRYYSIPDEIEVGKQCVEVIERIHQRAQNQGAFVGALLQLPQELLL